MDEKWDEMLEELERGGRSVEGGAILIALALAVFILICVGVSYL